MPQGGFGEIGRLLTGNIHHATLSQQPFSLLA